MMKRFLFLSVVFILFSCSKQEEIPSLEEALNRFNMAFENADVEVLASMIAENYVHTNSSWKSFGKDKWLGYMQKRKERIQNGELKIESYKLEELSIEYHGTTAIVTGKIVSSGVDNGEVFASEIRISNFWVIREGAWKRAGFHDTRIEK